MTSQAIQISIVIPAYNEDKRLASSLEKIVTYMSEIKTSFEVIVVNDGSTDQTCEVVHEKLQGAPYTLISNERNRGKGYSVRRGMLAARGAIMLYTDSDLSTPISEITRLLEALDSGADIAIGSRALRASRVTRRQNPLRELMGKTFNLIAHCLAFKGIHDSQCGFKAFKQEAAQFIFKRQKIEGFCFDAEILFLAQKNSFQIKEVGVEWVNSPQSKVRIVADSLSMLFDLFKIRLLHMGERAR